MNIIENQVELTREKLSGFTGIHYFHQYIEKTEVLRLLDDKFGHFKKNAGSIDVTKLFKQLFCFLFLGKSDAISEFDRLAKCPDYALLLEEAQEDIASSFQIKRFMSKFECSHQNKFRQILHKLFLNELHKKQPKEIEIYVDTMVMNNDSALKREGVSPTYKKVKGFQPLQASWNGWIIDAMFRNGSCHSNHGRDFIEMVEELVLCIRSGYRDDISIIIKSDSGFFDQANFTRMDALGVGFICSAKKYGNMLDIASSYSWEDWQRYKKKNTTWRYVDFEYGCDSWDNKYRAIYTSPLKEGKQQLIIGSDKDTVLITNIGVSDTIKNFFSKKRLEYWMKADTIIKSYHMCGNSELVHKRLKDFRCEHLPFRAFRINMAFYHSTLFAFNLFESFKKEILKGMFKKDAFAGTIRNRFLNCASKIVKRGRKYIIKVTSYTMKKVKPNLVSFRCSFVKSIFRF